MLIDKAEIERVKRGVDLVALVEARGVALERRGRQLVGLCPLHDDHEPSLVVDRTKQLWNCLGACREGGDAYAWVMKTEGLDFRGAHARLGGKSVEACEPATGDLEWLDRYGAHCHERLLASPEAQTYVLSREISADAVTAFRIGYADGTISKALSPEGRAALRRIGVLTGSGRELMRGCVVFPLVDADNRTVSLYGRHTKERRHLYLPGERRGLFNPSGARETDEVVLVESVIDAAAVWSVGIRNVAPIYGTTGLTDAIVAHLRECRVRRVVVMLDADEPGREAAVEAVARLTAAGIEARAVEGPAKDAAEYVASGGTAEALRALLSGVEEMEPAVAIERPSALEAAADGALVHEIDGREYRVRGLAPVGLDRLKVTVRLSRGGAFHLDTLDLYQARARSSFAQAAARLVGTNEAQTERDLLALVERLETARLAMG